VFWHELLISRSKVKVRLFHFYLTHITEPTKSRYRVKLHLNLIGLFRFSTKRQTDRQTDRLTDSLTHREKENTTSFGRADVQVISKYYTIYLPQINGWISRQIAVTATFEGILY